MKKHILALGLCLALLLTGCASMLNNEYLSVKPHSPLSAAEDDPDLIRVENYQELVSAILRLVSSCREQGVIQLTNYNTRDVEADLTAACLEVSHVDPLGAYAVDYIKHEYSRILTYYQATITIGYRRTLEQVKSIVPVTGSSAIRGEVRSALAGFRPEVVLRVTYFNEDETYIRSLARQAYYDTPAAAFGMPELEVSIYPEEGIQRIVEMVFTYPDAPETLRLKSDELRTAAGALVSPIVSDHIKGDALLSALYDALLAQLPTEEESEGLPLSSSPYAALVEGAPDGQALALAYKLLCDLAGVECGVAEGTVDGAPHFWTIVASNGEHRHVDAALGPEGFLLTDAEYQALTGAQWDAGAYPACGEALSTENDGEM